MKQPFTVRLDPIVFFSNDDDTKTIVHVEAEDEREAYQEALQKVQQDPHQYLAPKAFQPTRSSLSHIDGDHHTYLFADIHKGHQDKETMIQARRASEEQRHQEHVERMTKVFGSLEEATRKGMIPAFRHREDKP